MGDSMNLIELQDRRVDEAFVRAAENLVAAITFDDSASGGLLSRQTIRASDELRALLLRYRTERRA